MPRTMIRRIILLTCLILAVFAVGFAVLYDFPTDDRPANALQPQRETESYIVKSYQGYVAVFTSQKEDPIEITGTRVELLPLQDQLDLAEGIVVSSKEALSALLEDYGS